MINKEEILKQYKIEEERLLIAKMLDKLEQSKTKNKITYTDFLDPRQKLLIEKALKNVKLNNYYIFGGFEEAERQVAIFYPEKLNLDIIMKNDSQIFQVIEIKLPKELQNHYTHRDFLGGIMKLGIKREKIGDIVMTKEGADILALKEMIPFLVENLKELTRFKKSNIRVKTINELQEYQIRKEESNIMVSSMRLDNIISELAKTSRSKAEELIEKERVFLNFEVATKFSKEVRPPDKITIRGKGRFEIKEILGNSKKGKVIVKIEKYI